MDAVSPMSPSPLVGEGGSIAQSAIETGEGFSPPAKISPAETDPSSGGLRPPPSPQGEKEEVQFVLATRGGAAVVMNDVASSIARPNGVGIVMRKGTMMRVPA